MCAVIERVASGSEPPWFGVGPVVTATSSLSQFQKALRVIRPGYLQRPERNGNDMGRIGVPDLFLT